MPKAAIYARQSIEKKDSVSIESQIHKCANLCEYDGIEYIVYKDVGYSGKNLERPEFKKMNEAIQRGEINKVICYRLDRISRSIADFSQLILSFEKYGTEFVSATENFDSSTPLGRAMINIIMTFAQLERETITARIVDNYYFRGNNGWWAGGVAPFGYDIGKAIDENGKKQTTLVISEAEAETVRLFFDWYANQDYSIRGVASKANSLQLLSKTGTRWSDKTVSDVLLRPLYTRNTAAIYQYFRNLNANIINSPSEFDGKLSVNMYGKSSPSAHYIRRQRDPAESNVIVSRHEPIIDDTLWLKAQYRMNTNKKKPPREGQSTKSFLTGLLVCGLCGASIRIKEHKKYYRGYYCGSRLNKGKDACSLKTRQATELEKTILQNITEYFNAGNLLSKIDQIKQDKAQNNETAVEKNALNTKLIEIENEISNLISNISKGNTTTMKYINERIDELDPLRREIQNKLQAIEIKEYNNNIKLENLDYLLSTVTDLDKKLETSNIDDLKLICRSLVKKIIIKNDAIDIIYFI